MRYKIALAIIIALAVLVRISLSAHVVFADGFINFVGVDSYFHADLMRSIASTFPCVDVHYRYWLYDWLMVVPVWLIETKNPATELLERVIIFFPPLMAGCIVLMVYGIASRLFNNTIGLFSASLLAFMPGEFLARSLLGNIDHHSFEVLTTTLIILGLTLLITRLKYGLSTIVPLFFICVVAVLLYKSTWYGLDALLRGAFPAREILVTTQETQHILAVLAVGNYWPAIHIVISTVGTVVMLKHDFKRQRLILVPWVVGAVLLTAWQVRFDYYLAVPASILGGYLLYRICYVLQQKRLDMAVMGICIAVLVILIIPPFQWMLTNNLGTPTKDWNNALTWVRDNTEHDVFILSWPTYGYWVEYIAERRTYTDPGQDVKRTKEVARLFQSYGDAQFPGIVDYLIISHEMAYYLQWPMSVWSGNDFESINATQTLVVRIYESRYRGGQCVLKYATGNVKVYEIRR